LSKIFRDPRMTNVSGKPAWCITYKALDGKRHRERTDALTREEAEAILRRRMSELAQAKGLGLHSLDHLKPVQFEPFFRKEYLPAAESRVRPSTFQRKLQLSRHVLPFFGPLALRTINAGHIERYIEQRRRAKPRRGATVSPAEINAERALVSAVMSAAFRRGHIDLNPVARVRPLREDNARDRWLTPSEMEAILDMADPWVRPFIVMGVHTGLRLSEICNLAWSDVDFERGFLRVGHESKSHKVRYVPLNSVSGGVLESQKRCFGPSGPVAQVFVNPRRTTPYRSKSVSHDFKKAVRRLAQEWNRRGRRSEAQSLEGVTFHTTRHTFASWLIQRGIPEAGIQQYLGHSSNTMTRRYAHLAPATARRGALEILVNDPQVSAPVALQNGVSVAKEVASKVAPL